MSAWKHQEGRDYWLGTARDRQTPRQHLRKGPSAPWRHKKMWVHDHRQASQLCRSPDIRTQFLSKGPAQSQGTEEEMPGVWQTMEGARTEEPDNLRGGSTLPWEF